MKLSFASSSSVVFGVGLAFALTSAACGGGAPPPAASPDHHGHGPHHDAEGPNHEHAGIAPPLRGFHEVLAPVWHSPAGAERTTKACAAVASFKEKAAGTGDAGLVSGAAEIEKACAAPKEPEVEAALKKVHERFHELAEKGEHGEHGKHGEKGEKGEKGDHEYH